MALSCNVLDRMASIAAEYDLPVPFSPAPAGSKPMMTKSIRRPCRNNPKAGDCGRHGLGGDRSRVVWRFEKGQQRSTRRRGILFCHSTSIRTMASAGARPHPVDLDCEPIDRRLSRTRRNHFSGRPDRADSGLARRVVPLRQPGCKPRSGRSQAHSVNAIRSAAFDQPPRRRSSVNGKSGLRSSRGTCKCPGVCPMRKKRASRRASAS